MSFQSRIDNPLIYMCLSGILATASVCYMSMTTNNQSPKDLLLMLPLFPSASLILFNYVLSLILCFYFFLRFLFFGHGLNSHILEQKQILDNLFVFFSFKFVLISFVVEPSVLDMIVWILWCAVLAMVKAIIQHAVVRVEYLSSSRFLIFVFLFICL